ncbi:thiol reductant ABC exporter subunit CydC [Actinomyces wuliandei]|uniref:thiol reductant ABC exporter subunit CydC n=1 Tax=Actinomyces wuliandei TaxID=2057743 RepID=UPI000FDAD390|nr:thiol reductant ABC exporter subunit CydC [Actinomyces wuliandei]
MTPTDTAATAGTLRGVLSSQERHALRRATALTDLDCRRFAGAVLAGAAGTASAVALSAVAAWLIAQASLATDIAALGVAPVAVRLLGISRSVLRYCERLISHDTALRGMSALRTHLYEILASARTDAVVSLRRGDVLARVGADVDAVGDLVVRAYLPMAVTATVGAATCLGLAAVYWPSAVVVSVCLLATGIIGPLATARSSRLAELARQEQATDLSSTVMTVLESGPELAVSSRLADVMDDLARTEDRLAGARDRAARPAAAATAVDSLAMGAAVLGNLLVGLPAVQSGRLGEVWLAVIVLVPLAAFETTSSLAPATVQLVRSAGAARRVVAMIEAAEAGTALPSAAPGTAPRTTPSSRDHRAPARPGRTPRRLPRAHLHAQDLAVGWPGGPAVAEGISLDLAPGRRIALVGPSGIGKTTLVLTLAGMLEPRGGTLALNGTAPWLRPRQEVAASLTVTAEDAHVFDTTVLENLRVAHGDLSPEQARLLLRQAGLGDWLDSLPEGLDTVVGANATTVSGGERRRLLLARALAAPAPLMVLDEPGEHLDPATADRLVADLLQAGGRERGVLLVTHRLSALAAADEVIIMGRPQGEPHDGQGPATVIGRGSHEQLVATHQEYRWSLAQESPLPQPAQRPRRP